MDLQQNNGAAVQNDTAKTTINHVAQNGTAKSPVNGKAEVKAKSDGAKTEPVKVQEPKQDKPQTNPAQPLAAEDVTKPILTLESKLKAVGDLHRKSVQRLNLISRMKQLEEFEVNLSQENDELEDNPYQGCKLIIEDDKKRQFVTTTPGLIRLVSQFIYGSCDEKLVEIENSIVFPNV